MTYQWNIFWVDLGQAKDSEQAGTRPVLVVSAEPVNQALGVVTVVPLTTLRPGRRVYPTEALLPAAETGLPQDSLAMAQQIRTIAKSRLGQKAGVLTAGTARDNVRRALRLHLDID